MGDGRRQPGSPGSVHHLIAVLSVGMTAAQFSGCADLARLEAREQAGWRQGWVYQMVEGRDLRDVRTSDCASALSSDRVARQRFAIVRYAVSIGARTHQLRTVPVPDSLELKVRDRVEINILDCDVVITRVGR